MTTLTRTGRRKLRTARLVRSLGWSLISVGTLVLLYLVYLLAFTNLTTGRAQDDLLEAWQAEVGTLSVGGVSAAAPAPALRPPQPRVDLGDAYAAIWFERPASNVPIVHDGPLFVVEGTDVEPLKRGPGHYPTTATPGGDGNFAVAGHRTTYGAPFYHLDALTRGDEVHVVDRQGRQWVYVVNETRIVGPGDAWVLGDDPLGVNQPTMTLTTCHPRFSAAQRLIVFAGLRDQSVA